MPSDCTVDTDLVFVLDESGSITEPNFMTVRNFVYNFTNELLTTDSDSDMQMALSSRATGSRVGVITFDSDATEWIALNSTLNRSAILSQIRELPYDGGGTDTADGLELMVQQLWREEISVLRLAIVISDGQSNNQKRTVIAAEAVHAHSPPIVVYAVGVGESADEQELRTIASGSQAYTHIDSFLADSFNTLSVSYAYQICFSSKCNNNINTSVVP